MMVFRVLSITRDIKLFSSIREELGFTVSKVEFIMYGSRNDICKELIEEYYLSDIKISANI
jgi:hypothetical protein